MLDAYETVESWMMARNKLNPGKLIPAMMRYVSEPHAKYDMGYTPFPLIATLRIILYLFHGFSAKISVNMRESYDFLYFETSLRCLLQFCSCCGQFK